MTKSTKKHRIMKQVHFLLCILCVVCLAGCKQDIEISDAPEKTFSVGDGLYVHFAQGNLRYNYTTGEYRFADHQYDMLGQKNFHDVWGDEEDTNHEVWTDLLYDWGLDKCYISNGENGPWTYLTTDQWGYLLYSRINASTLFGVGIVNGINGLILLPDNWQSDKHKAFVSGFSTSGSYEQTFTLTEWQDYENSGAVFLPASGHMTEESCSTGKFGAYLAEIGETTWSNYGTFIQFNAVGCEMYMTQSEDYARAFRLVHFVEK